LQEQLLRTGTTTRTKDQLDEEIDFIGASLSTSATGIYASSLKKHTNKLLDLMSDVLLNSDFKQEELDKIKLQTMSALASQKDDPSAIARNVKNALVYGKNHPYGEPVTEETVEPITLEMCKEYYQTFFKPNISYLAIVGDITKKEAENLVKKYFGTWQRGDVPKFSYETPTQPEGIHVAVVDRANAVQSSIRISYPIQLKKGEPEELPAIVMNTILGGSFSSRLNQNLRETNAYTYGARSSTSPDKLVGSFDAFADARNEVTGGAVREFFNEMKRIRNEKVSEDEIESTINFISGGFARSLENPQTIATFAINIERYNLPKDYYTNYLKNIASVDVNDVYDAAQKYIRPENAYVVVVGNNDDIKDSLTGFGEINYYDMYGNEIDESSLGIPEGLTGEDIINDYVEAIGGKENLAKLNDRTTSMEGSVQGIPVKITAYQKAPNLLKQKISAGGMEQEIIFDGQKGVMTAGGNNMNIEGDELEKLKLEATIGLLLDYESHGLNFELKGGEKIENKTAYKVEVKLPSGGKWTQYFDPETGYKIKELKNVTTPQGTFTQETLYSDYREVEGVKYPFEIKQSLGPQKLDFKVTSIEVNQGLQDSFFVIE
jgi:zinc protease